MCKGKFENLKVKAYENYFYSNLGRQNQAPSTLMLKKVETKFFNIPKEMGQS